MITIAAAAAIVPVSIALSSGGDPAAAGGGPRVSATPVLRDLDGVTLPLERYALSDQEVIEVYRARRSLQRSCIRRVLGNVRLGDIGERVPAPAHVSIRPMRYLDPKVTARMGYQAPAEASATSKTRHTASVSPKIMREALKVAHGSVSKVDGRPVPKGGCISAAERELTRGVSSRLDPRTLILQADAKTEKDSRYLRTMEKWSACMNRAGLHYRNLDQARNDPHWSARDGRTPDKASITTREIKVATADAKCRQETNVYGVWAAVESAYQEQTVHDMGSRLRAAGQAQRRLLRNAQAALR